MDRHLQKEARSLGEAFEVLRRICAEEDYNLEIPLRQEQANPLVDPLDELKVQRTVPSLPSQESELLTRINEGLPTQLADRYQELIAKRRTGSLTSEEHAELLRLTDEVEGLDAERIRHLSELARLRKTSLSNLMNELGIQS